MTINAMVLIWMWVCGIIAFFFIPANRKRSFIMALLISQALLWLDALLRVQFHLIAFPVREFPKATEIALTKVYFFYPVLCAIYTVIHVGSRRLLRFLHLMAWTFSATLIDMMLENYTELIQYVNFTWYWTWFNFIGVFVLTSWIQRWFFKDKAWLQSDRSSI